MPQTLPFVGALLALTFFLLRLYGGSASCGGPPPLVLPTAYYGLALERAAPIVAIGPKGTTLNGLPTDVEPGGLEADLKALRDVFWLVHPGDVLHLDVLLCADRALAAGVVTKLVRRLEAAGYDVELVVEHPLL